MKLSERLVALLALVEKATPGPWRWSLNGNIVPEPYTDDCEIAAVYSEHMDDIGVPANADAIIAAINFLRDHGQSLAELARRVEDAEVAHVEPKNGTAVLHERCLPLAMIGQRVRIVPDDPTPPPPGHEREGRQSPHCTCTTDPSITCIVHPQEVPDGGR